MDIKEKRLVIAQRAADVLGVKKQRIYQIVRKKVLPAGIVVHIGRQLRFDLDALQNWIERGGSTGMLENDASPNKGGDSHV